MNKVAFITGGSRGIGENIVKELAKQGHKVILNYNKSEEKAKKIKKELKINLQTTDFQGNKYAITRQF